MKTIGLIGGMSWESSLIYYRLINELVREELGGFHSAQIIMSSLDFSQIEQYQRKGQWDEAGKIIATAAQSVERGGADFFLLCTNTMHKVAPYVQGQVSIPLIHIGDATADKVLEQEIKKIGLLGTLYTMEQGFYKNPLRDRGIEVLIPNHREREMVNMVIFDELCQGKLLDSSKERYLDIIDHLVKEGAQGIVLGCTEICLLINQDDVDIPLFDTTYLHAAKAVKLALS